MLKHVTNYKPYKQFVKIMKRINSTTIIGTILNLLILIYTMYSPRYNSLTLITVTSLILCILGLVFIITNKVKIGSIFFYIGSIVFVPIGVIGIIGVRQIISKIEEEKFNKKNYG